MHGRLQLHRLANPTLYQGCYSNRHRYGTHGGKRGSVGASNSGEAPGPPPLLPPTLLAVVPERELLCWWESEGVVEAADPGDLVLLLHGLAQMGLQPRVVLTRRLLEAVMGSPPVLAQLPPQHLALLCWGQMRHQPCLQQAHSMGNTSPQTDCWVQVIGATTLTAASASSPILSCA
ncbi:hypothetical protein VOLCADRAFT_86482 [Volvox carteri f. nagariensis]|uniref:Uncharacterized protein n=1 Tax=Volvox carteri f. nagariensis TaxID=3068 RepID=D8TGU1_VOLCA|nr:uncharacterized protein VOLCADRAFT_86482 [Volvox carteri f. nagariensis]EFJ52958.1 hypothetical protein VOLCADRAFT_86482 [Volvox carteri f. nagariensis]|eukprot:XP_002945963.1 hypothetical protein VOLCADRAFT_86482 [Volvox carteri f. nagariensis]